MSAPPPPTLAECYQRMVLIRTVEESLLGLFSTGALRGTVHTCLGQEAVAVGVAAALRPDRDVVCTNHRGHGHYLAVGGPPRALIAEVMGLSSGISGGIGGSQHLHFKNFYSNGILGGMAPVATGMALAEKKAGGDGVVVLFIGDGAMAEGTVYEAFNMAALWRLPMLFVCESNGYAQSTAIAGEIAGDLTRRGEAFGLAAASVDGNDVEAVCRVAADLVQDRRRGSGAALLVANTYRLGPHSKGDDFRDRDEIAAHAAEAPCRRARRQLDPQWCDSVEAGIAAEVAGIIEDLQRELRAP